MIEESLIKVLSYFDIFDYPLTFEEIKKYLDIKLDCTDEDLEEILYSISIIQQSGGYYYLLGRQDLVAKRIDRNNISILKLARAKVVAKILSYIPTVKYIGVSGSLSMGNTSSTDDIDLFFITRRNTLWLTRALVNLTLIVLRQKRNKNGKITQDKICPNMLVDEDNLNFNGKNKTLYIAHEIIQLKTLVDKADLYKKLINKNYWIYDFFPNLDFVKYEARGKKDKFITNFLLKMIAPFEKLAYLMQRGYMGSTRLIGGASPKRAYFHPHDRQRLIMEIFKYRNQRNLGLFADNLWIDKEDVRYYIEEKKIRILN